MPTLPNGPHLAAAVTGGPAADAGELLVDHLLAARDTGLPEPSRGRSAELIVDVLGAALAAHDAAGMPGVRAVVTGWGGRPEATIIGTRHRVPAPSAVLVNAALARALELDDVHERALVHASATIVPVALAVAERLGGVSGRRFVDAVTLGNDIACRLALGVDMQFGGSGHQPRVMSLTYQAGVLAGSLVAGYLAGLDRAQLLDCLGIGYSQVAGNLQGLVEGTLTVRLQQGIAAQAAVMALDFARAGITGAHACLEGRAGWYPAFFGGRYEYSRDRLTAGLGSRFLGDEISIKPYACCKYGHSVITAAVRLSADPGVAAGAIQQVLVPVGRDTWDIICDPLAVKASPEALAAPDGLALAQFSLPFMVATALLRGRLGAAELDAGWRSDPRLAALLGKVTIVLADRRYRPDLIPEPGRVEVVLADGRRRSAEAVRPPGHPEHRLGTAALHAKFRSGARRLGERRTEALLDALTHLDALDDVARVARLTMPAAQQEEHGDDGR
jgi:2-methylcitrate dehydratase PrpD